MSRWHGYITGSLPGPAWRRWPGRHTHQDSYNSTRLVGAVSTDVCCEPSECCAIMRLSAFYSRRVRLTRFAWNLAPWLAGSRSWCSQHGGRLTDVKSWIYLHCAKKLYYISYTKLLHMDSMDINIIVENYHNIVFDIYHYKLNKCCHSALAKTMCQK